MLNFSITEIILTAAIAVLALKQEDVSLLVKHYHKLRRFVTHTALEVPSLLDEDTKQQLSELKQELTSTEEELKNAEPKLIVGDDGASYVAYPEFAADLQARKGRPSKTPTTIYSDPDHEDFRS